MRPLHTFRVHRQLPEAITALEEVASNLRWAWDRQTQELFRWIDPALWEETDQNALLMLETVSTERLDEIAEDGRFLEFLKKVKRDLDAYVVTDSWFQERKDSPLERVAYFSPEFGISSALPQYSGGLGVLAGDHLKSCSALGVPLVGVGLFYKQGYFRQGITPRGNQFERYPTLDPISLGLSVACEPILLDLGDESITVKVWLARLGRIKLYLLDTDHEENSLEVRAITDRLYGGDTEHRIRQEIVLGMGGVKALRRAGETIQLYHSNEGHAGFLGLERIREMLTTSSTSFEEAKELVKSSNVFTTHTPVPAGIDRFSRALMEKYFSKWAKDCGIELDALLALGHTEGEDLELPFNMAVMGLRLSARANGVSALHEDVSKDLFKSVWPQLSTEQIPIMHVTNGVHPATWVSQELSEFYVNTIHPNWANATREEWSTGLAGASDDSLWQLRESMRAKMIPEVRKRLRTALLSSGWEDANLSWCDTVLNPKALTIGFARRFAPYKRADLLLSQAERLVELCTKEDRPVQFIFAGKAHPADDPGKDLVKRVFDFAFTSSLQGKFVFVPDYDMSLARSLVQGCDVWLNTPTRPLEASGTSGMKAALNGTVNLSILDGWWAECYNGENGWAIASSPNEFLEEERIRFECDSLFSLLEGSVVPEFYDRTGQVPQQWTKRMKSSLATLAPFVSGHRMVRDYVEKIYEPTAQHVIDVQRESLQSVTALVNWKERVAEKWHSVSVLAVDTHSAQFGAGDDGTDIVNVSVRAEGLTSADLTVEVIWGPIGGDGAFKEKSSQAAQLLHEHTTDGATEISYESTISPQETGNFGFLIAVRPSHPDLLNEFELGLQIFA